MPKQSFMRGAMVLTTASVITKILGMLIQVVIARQLGAAGFGLFRTVNPIFFMLLTISTLALAPALSKVIAENLALGNIAKARHALRVSNATVLVLSVAVTAIAIVVAPHLSARWLDPRAYLPFLGTLFRIPLVCLSSMLTGFYMGTQHQTPPAIGWILETLVRTVVTIPLILQLNPYGIQYGALAVAIGAGLGELVGYLYMLWCYLRRDRDAAFGPRPTAADLPSARRGTIHDLAEVALPNTVRNICGILAYAAEPIIIYLAFARIGVGKTAATSLYGSFGMAIQLLLLPTVLSSSLSSVVIPAVSEAAAMRNTRLVSRRLNQIVQITFLIALPATAFLILSGDDLATTLYRDHLAGALLAYIAPVCAFIYVRDPLAAVLQGLNKATLSAAISLFTSAIRMAGIYYFVGILGHGIYGVAQATAITAVLSTLLGAYFVHRYATLAIPAVNLFKMVLATAIAAVPIYQTHTLLAADIPSVHVVVSVLAGCVVYTLALVYMRVLPLRALARIPWIGNVLANMLQRLPFVE
ncbi:MAG: oligosaccharide flippase family protein [Alicyclobacillus sp.]|nr:oligosaccharide flippase family protein [Alicyclobacillus sp.]